MQLLRVIQHKRVGIVLSFDGPHRFVELGWLDTPERLEIQVYLVILIRQRHLICLGKLPPIKEPLSPQNKSFSERNTYQVSNPFGGARLYRRLYSATASSSVLLCLSCFSFHALSALAMSS